MDRDVAQPGSALRSGRRGRWFESSHPDSTIRYSSNILLLGMDSHFVYIIESGTTGKWYYGYTTDLAKRLTFHNQGNNISTRNRGPWKYIFTRKLNSKKEAMDFEKYLKASRNKEYIKRAYSDYFI